MFYAISGWGWNIFIESSCWLPRYIIIVALITINASHVLGYYIYVLLKYVEQTFRRIIVVFFSLILFLFGFFILNFETWGNFFYTSFYTDCLFPFPFLLFKSIEKKMFYALFKTWLNSKGIKLNNFLRIDLIYLSKW